MPSESADFTSYLIETAAAPAPTAPFQHRDPAAEHVDDLRDPDFDGDFEHDHGNEHFEPVSRFGQFIYMLGIVLPFLGLVAAVSLLWGWGFDWQHAVVFGVMYFLTSVGVTVGYHRLFTHKAFKTVPAVSATLAFFGSMAVEGSLVKWAAVHRCHHKHSDGEADPHSPHGHGAGMKGMLKGMLHSHMTWILQGDPKDLDRYAPDLRADPLLRFMGKYWWVWALLGLFIPAALGGLLTWSWMGVLLGFLWGGLVRVFFVHHTTWSINSVCHIWGTRPFRSHDESRNNWIMGLIGLGEGWHNNHHAFPTSARHGLRWWEFDLSYLIIRGLEKLGLAWDIKVPEPARIAAKAR